MKADGTIANRRTFFDEKPFIDPKFPGMPDGMKFDQAGNIWTGAFGGITVINPAGKVIGRLYTGEQTANCNWGDDGSTLYIAADYFLLRIKTKTKGAGW
jgi:gluconolactonase